MAEFTPVRMVKTIQISPQWTGAFEATNTMTVDRIRAVEGDVPRFA